MKSFVLMKASVNTKYTHVCIVHSLILSLQPLYMKAKPYITNNQVPLSKTCEELDEYLMV